MDISLEYYRFFYYAGKTGSITAAADLLHVSQPAVSQGIKNLEEALGSRVFVRTPKGVSLTTEGEVLYHYVEMAFLGVMAGEQKFRELLELEEGRVRIGASDMTLKFFILPFLERFHEAYPKVKLTVTNAPTPRTLQHIKDGLIDFGVVSGPLDKGERYQMIPVRKIQDIFVAGKKYQELKGRTVSYETLKEYPFLCLEGETSSRQYVEGFLAKKGVVLQPEIQLATSDMLVLFAEKGLGITCVVEDFAKEAMERGDLFQIQLQEELPERNICIVLDRHAPVSAAADRLIKWMTT